MITVKEVLTKKQEKDFFTFPLKLYKGSKYCAPALIAEEKAEFNPKINGAFEFCIARKFVAYSGKKPVGRIAGIFHQRYNLKKNVKQIRFTRFDVIDDIRVSDALMCKLKEWAQELGMDEIIGPIGFSDLDKQGMLIDGFDEPNLYVTAYNYPYYPEHMQRLGFNKLADWLEYEIYMPKNTEKLDRVCQFVAKKYNYQFMPIKNYKDIEDKITDVLMVIMNDAFEPLFGVTKLNSRQIEREKALIKTIFNPDFVAVVQHKGQMVGYSFMAPNISKAMRICKGRLTPWGVFALMRGLKKFSKVDLYSIGVLTEHQSKGVNALLMSKAIKALKKYNINSVYTGPELEANTKVRGQWDDFEKRVSARRRCYGLKIEE